MTIKFNEAPADASKGFRIGHEQSLFVNNVEFTLTGYKLGTYTITADDGTESPSKYASTSQNIVFTTSIGEDLPLNRLLNRRRVIYDEDGKATIVESCNFKGALRKHLESLGRRPDAPDMLVGTADDVAKHAIKFFEGKTLRVVEFNGFGRDNKNRLQPLLSPAVQFQFKD